MIFWSKFSQKGCFQSETSKSHLRVRPWLLFSILNFSAQVPIDTTVFYCLFSFQLQRQFAENLVEDGNKLLQTCIQKINKSVFLNSQLKVMLGQKREKQLAIELETQHSAGEEKALNMSFVGAQKMFIAKNILEFILSQLTTVALTEWYNHY